MKVSFIVVFAGVATCAPLWSIGSVFDAVIDALNPMTYWPEVVSHALPAAPSAVEAWSIYSLAAFPAHSIRFKSQVKLCDPSVKQIVGYLDVGSDKHFFFWFFESRNKPATDPLVLWLNGGPGCSSLTGLLMELGPCRVVEGGNTTALNPHSFSNKANIIFLDQPVNAGFSYGEGEPISTSETAAADVYAFLQLFLTSFPKYAKLPFHVTGESYAGHYIPAIAAVISEENGLLEPGSENVRVELKSLMIGNGLTDPLNQYDLYPEMACNSNYGPLLSEEECATMRSKTGTCRSLIDACYKFESRFTCVPGSIYCNNAMIGPIQKSGINVYDVRTKCEPGNPLCYRIISDIETWANKPYVQQVLGVDREFKV